MGVFRVRGMVVAWCATLAAGVAGPAAAQTLTLQAAVARAVEQSPERAAAEARREAAVAARRVVPRLPDPSIELRAENLGTTPPAQLPRDVFATLSQPVEFGGKHAGRLAAADAQVRAADAVLRDVTQAVTRQMVEVYLDAVRAREVAASLRAQFDGMGGFVDLLRARVQEGVTAEADLRRLEAERGRLGVAVTRATLELTQALAELSLRLGYPVSADSLSVPALVPPVTSDATAPLDVSTRADVLRAEADLALAIAARETAQAAAVPDLTVTAGYKRTNGQHAAAVGVTMPIGVFDRNRMARVVTAGDATAAARDLAAVKVRAEADIRTRLEVVRVLTAQVVRETPDVIAPAEVARLAARAAFTEGRGDLLHLLDAERALGDITREAIALRLDALLSIAHLRLALGLEILP